MSHWLPSLLALAAAGVHARGLLRPGAGVAAGRTQSELFGFERAREFLARSTREIPKSARPWDQNDDITVVTVRRKA